MPDMASLKRTRDAIDDEPAQDFFPHSLFLAGDEMEKLGLSGAEVGGERMMVARVRVSSVSERQTDDGVKRDMNLEFVEATTGEMPAERSQAERLFGRS